MASVSTTKSSSNWLDRLRSSRGFPTGEEPDLGRFLSSSSSGSAPTTESTQSRTTIRDREIPGRKNDEQWLGEVSNVLCDLFNMGEGSSRSFSKKKKSSRKQANPRFCGANEENNNNNNELCSSDDLRRENNNNGLASSGDNSLNERREKIAAADAAGAEEREEDGDVDLKAYSRNEVFVIDTSLSDWKFDGWVFRKNDEWKIKEKKGKARVSGGKKRKLLVSALNNGNSDKDQKKKMKMMNSDGVRAGHGLELASARLGQLRNEEKDQPFKEPTDSLGKVPQKRCPCPRPPEKSGNEGSSVILLKTIPLNNISEAPKLGKSSQKKCPRKMMFS